jgi:hypothetical protein
MCSGLISQVEGGTERPEDIGERYLTQLTKKSFFSFVPTGSLQQTLLRILYHA